MLDIISRQIKFLIGLCAILVAVEVINLFTGRALAQLGVYPRDISHLAYVFTAPFIHGGPAHLASNLLTLVIFITLCMQWGGKTFLKVSAFILVASGLGVWMFGREALHIGASGMVYGYFGFLVLAGFLSRKLPLILISVVVAGFYGSMVFGVLPTRAFVSFEYHLFGFMAGLVSARIWGKNIS